jgi:hypothetical protein
MAGLVPAIPISDARLCNIKRAARHIGERTTGMTAYNIAADFAIGIMRCDGQPVGTTTAAWEKTP